MPYNHSIEISYNQIIIEMHEHLVERQMIEKTQNHHGNGYLLFVWYHWYHFRNL